MNARRVVFQAVTESHSGVSALPPSASLEERVIAQLKSVYDPEIPLNIYDLGLIYDIQIKQDKDVHIVMTLTTPGCPVAGSMPGQVERAVSQLQEVEQVHVELVWDPPWDKERMTDEAKLTLGLF